MLKLLLTCVAKRRHHSGMFQDGRPRNSSGPNAPAG